MPESSDWARNMGWTAVGAFAGTVTVLVGWFQVYRGMTPDQQKDNGLFWVLYLAFALIFSITAFVGFKIDQTVRKYQQYSKADLLSADLRR